MAMIVETYASQCDTLVFVTAGDAPLHFRGYAVIDLRKRFPIGQDPKTGQQNPIPNTIEKTFWTLLYAAKSLHQKAPADRPHVTCRLDSDTLFIPQNLRRILACRNFSTEEPWAIGFENYAHKHQQPGRVFLNGGTGICMSQGALGKLRANMEDGGHLTSESTDHWNVGACIMTPGHWDDVVLGACLAYLKVPISRWGTDCMGRSLFWPDKVQHAFVGPAQIRPPRLPPKASFFQPPTVKTPSMSGTSAAAAGGIIEADSVGEIEDGKNHSNVAKVVLHQQTRQTEVANYHFWLYRAWQHLACDPKIWLADYPVGFHPYRNRTEGRKTFDLFARRAQFQGYTMKFWNGDISDGSCESLLC